MIVCAALARITAGIFNQLTAAEVDARRFRLTMPAPIEHQGAALRAAARGLVAEM